MSQTTISSQQLDSSSALRSFVGLDPAGRRVAWLGYSPNASPGRAHRPMLAEPLQVPPELPEGDLHAALSHVPAWRLTRLAAMEPGGVVMVVGDGWLAQDALRMSRLHGCLWSGLWGGEGQPPVSPRPFDAAVLLRITGPVLDAVAAAVRDRGVVVVAAADAGPVDHGFYPHAHRRGLMLEFTNPTTATEEDLQNVLRLMRLGLASTG